MMNRTISKELEDLLKSPKGFDFLFNDIKDDEIKDLFGNYTKARDFISEDNFRYRFYFTKWNEYVDVHTQYDAPVDSLIYILNGKQIPELNSNQVN